MHGKTVVLGVSGGIAAYKACELASRLTQQGVIVPVVMTAAAQRFVAPLTFQALTHQPVHTSLWPEVANTEAGTAAAMAHIALADSADAILIAPASADLLARLAHGLADDLLTTLVLATRAPVLLAPAMNPTMLAHPATQRNLQILRESGAILIDPESGRMACEHIGSGRLPPSETLIAHLRAVLFGAPPDAASKAEDVPPRDLAGQRVLITAGPTREALDPVRYLSNRSSGRMGFSLAAEATSRGAEVILVCGPCRLETPSNVQRVDVTTTAEMFEAVMGRVAQCDIVIGAAAPADFQVARPSLQKIKKTAAIDGRLSLELVPAPDIIAAVGGAKKPHQLVVGFAAETQNIAVEARRKLGAKSLDAIVANDVTQSDAGFDVETNRVTWITADAMEEWPLLSKRAVAARIFDKIVALHKGKS